MRLTELTEPHVDYWEDKSTHEVPVDTDAEKQHQRLVDHYYIPHRDKVRGDLTDAVEHYTSHSFPLNNKLMTGKVTDVHDYWQDKPHQGGEEGYDWDEHFDSIHDRLHRFMDKMPAAPEHIHSFAGVGALHGAELAKTPVGGTHEAKAWISTSISPIQSEGFNRCNHIAHFSIPQGSKVGAYLEGYSNNGGENEFLIRHGTKWKKTGESWRGKFCIHHLEPAE